MEGEENAPDGEEVAAEQDNAHCQRQSEVLRCVLHQDLPDGVEEDLVSQLFALSVQIVDDPLHQVLGFTDHQDVPHQCEDVDGWEEEQDDHWQFVSLTQLDHLSPWPSLYNLLSFSVWAWAAKTWWLESWPAWKALWAIFIWQQDQISDVITRLVF